jgi:peptidoglycan/LPS O-acetylase OafA/YrhL
LLVPREEAGGGILVDGMYALTSMGHGAVMVFFVLSGYFVGGSIIRGRRAGTFSWPVYLASRSIRLWLVLIPALILTMVLDRIGVAVFSLSERYGEGSDAVVQSTPLIWFGNALFQQTQLVPPFGSNGALWSLGYEFAYYLLFPLVLIGVMSSSRWRSRAVAVVLTVLVCVLAGPWALILFIGWLLGAGIAWQAPPIRWWIGRRAPVTVNVMRVAAVFGLVAGMALDKLQGGSPTSTPPGTFVTALFATALVALLVTDVHPRSRIARGSLSFTNGLAESSYSLYAYHLPVLTLVAVMLTPVGDPSRFMPDAFGWPLVATVTLALIAGGWLFARGTEYYYDPIKDWVVERMPRTNPTLRVDGPNSLDSSNVL